jgi:L-amino acid N-acyltransferase YncA
LGIRAACQSDLEAILDIYNDAVVNTTATFGTLEEVGLKFNRWLNVSVYQYRCGS